MRRIALILAVLLLAGTAGALETVLTPDSVLFSIENGAPQARLEVVRRAGEVRETLVVPTTDDEAIESDAHLAFDQPSGTLYVAWHRAGDDDRILIASYDATGTWSEPLVVVSDNAQHAGLSLVVTRVRWTTLVHAAWWKIDGQAAEPEYALVAFEAGQHMSTAIENLDDLAGTREAAAYELDDDSEAVHPPLAMARADQGVDVVFGAKGTTAVTRVHISPKSGSDARIWKPVGRTGDRMPGAKITSNSTEPVRAFISKGRVVLYSPDSQFRYVVWENGRWSPARMIQLDETLSSDAVLYELRKTVDDQAEADNDVVTH